MKSYYRASFFLIVICFTSVVTFSQQTQFEFNSIKATDFEVIKTKDSSAVAEVIADVGRTRFEYGPTGFYLIFERRTRIHILKPEGTSQATIEIPLYKSDNNEEIVASFKGYTYNLEKGEVVKTKVKKEDIFLQEDSENWNTQKVALPAVKANSIIEYEYEIHSNFTFNLQPWAFQSDIPVSWSEYNVKIPEYFTYKTIAQGYIPFALNKSTTSQQQFTVRYESEINLGIGQDRTSARSELIKLEAVENRWVAIDVPAMKAEPFITTVNDYISKIEFELSVVKMPGELSRNVMNTWETLNDKLLENEDFGLAIRKGGFISDRLPEITKGATNDIEKVTAIFDHVKNRMKWNANNGIFANNIPKKVYDERTGSVADINLMMVAILKEAGVNCEPVILSTRNHGRIQENYPILSKFNYVVAMVKIDTMRYLLDASSKYVPFNSLPEHCLNDKGRIISKNNPGWIELLTDEVKNIYTSADLSLSDDGSMKGNCIITTLGMESSDRRNTYNNKTEKEFIEEFTNEHQSWTVTDFHISNQDTLKKPFIESCTLEIPDQAQVAGDYIYLNIMSGFGMRTNPFKLEKRVYPVDFSCPIKENYSIKLNIPAGWIVEQLPKQTRVSLPDKAGSFKLMFQNNGDFIQIISSLNINKNIFLPTEYDDLKEFFRLIVAKNAEQIVLKKT